jgi:hypothetical protein
MAISKSDLQFYLTSIEPAISQTIRSQSLGGFPAITNESTDSLVYPSTILTSSLGLYSLSFTVDDFEMIEGAEYIAINDEVLRVEAVSSSNVSVLQRGVNGRLRVHLADDAVLKIDSLDIFNDNFNDSFKQYRCVALKNLSAVETAYNLEIFTKQISRNVGSSVRLAIEMPKSQFYSGTITTDGVNKKQVVISDLVDAYADSYFVGAYLRFVDGDNVSQGRIVSSYDSATGIIFLDSDLPYRPKAGDSIEIDPSPSQRIVTGVSSPIVGTGFSTSFAIAEEGSEYVIESIEPENVIYIWLERTISKDGQSMDANNVVIGLKYSES